MRISDWSSDVCSSDLRRVTCSTRPRGKVTRPGHSPVFRRARCGPYSQFFPPPAGEFAVHTPEKDLTHLQIGKAWLRERGGTYVEISGDVGSINKKTTSN